MSWSFWMLVAALLAAVLGVLAWPLLGRHARGAGAVDIGAANAELLRDQLDALDAELAAGEIGAAEHAAARDELERRVLHEAAPDDAHGHRRAQGAAPRSVAGALALLLGVPGLALVTYLGVGNLDALDPLLRQPAHLADAHDVEALVQRLAERMQAQPEDPEGWALLGRAYASLDRFEQARDALAQAVQRRADDPRLRADYADMIAMAQGRSLVGEPERQVLLALQTDPDNLKALALAGSAAMQRDDAPAAIGHWQRALQVAGEDHPLAEGLRQGLRDARQRAGLPEPRQEARAAPGGGDASAMPARVLEGQVRVADTLASQLRPGDTLFVYALAADGPRAPLAVQRGEVGPASGWPVAFTLDDSMAMAPALRLSAFERVVVVARISRRGLAEAASGDLEGRSAPLRPGSGPVELVIDRVLP